MRGNSESKTRRSGTAASSSAKNGRSPPGEEYASAAAAWQALFARLARSCTSDDRGAPSEEPVTVDNCKGFLVGRRSSPPLVAFERLGRIMLRPVKGHERLPPMFDGNEQAAKPALRILPNKWRITPIGRGAPHPGTAPPPQPAPTASWRVGPSPKTALPAPTRRGGQGINADAVRAWAEGCLL